MKEERPDSGRREVLTGLTGLAVAPVLAGALNAQTPVTASGDAIDVRLFGARCDGITDDSQAVQAAISSATEGRLASPILIPGVCRIERAINVVRPVDTTQSVLRFVGQGPGAGFRSSLRSPMFTGLRARNGSPGTEFLRFETMRFEGGTSDVGPVMSGDFLRVVFAFCEFIGIACLRSDHYAQEWRFINCLARGWSGTFFQAAGGYGVTSTSSKYQFGGAGFKIADPTLERAGCVGCSFFQDIFEGSEGPFLEFELGKGVSVAGLYSEGNRRPTIVAGGRAPNTGISVTGSFFAPRDDNKARPGFADIEWNWVQGAVSIGNMSLGRLHRRSERMSDFVTLGDHAEIR